MIAIALSIGRSSVRRFAWCMAWLVSLGLLFGATTLATAAETWAARLGYPPEQRVIILSAGEMGLAQECNQAGKDILTAGQPRSATVMVPCPWFNEFARWSQQHPDLDVGIAISLNSEWRDYRWRSVSDRSSVPSLIDADGYLWRSPLQTAVNGTLEDVTREIEAQLSKARSGGFRPSHMTTHLGTLFSRPDFAEAYLAVSRKHWIPAAVVELTPEHIIRFRAMGFPLSDRMIELITNYPLPKVDDLQFCPEAASYEEKRDALFEIVRQLSPGLTRIDFQPAVESSGLKQITASWQQRVWDAQLLKDPALAQFLEEQQVALTDWKEVMARFEGKGPAVSRLDP